MRLRGLYLSLAQLLNSDAISEPMRRKGRTLSSVTPETGPFVLHNVESKAS
jgi:hypothetical protein